MNRNPDGTELTNEQLAAMVPHVTGAGHGYNWDRSFLLQATIHIRFEMFLNRELELRTETRAETERLTNTVNPWFLTGQTPGNGRFGRGKEVYNGRLGHPHVETT